MPRSCFLAFLQQQARSFCRAHRGPVLYLRMADCTPSKARYQVTAQASDGERITRHGFEGIELLVQRGWIIAEVEGGKTKCLPILRDPLLVESTNHWTYAAAALDLFPPLRSLRPRGIHITATILDGAGFQATSRVLEQYTEAYTACRVPGQSRTWARWSELAVSFCCVLHSCNGGARWMMKQYLPLGKDCGKMFLKSIHVACAALRNGFDLLVKGVPLLMNMIEWDETDGDDPALVEELWRRLGMNAKMLPDMVALNPRVRDGRIHCNAACRAWPNICERVAAVYIYTWRFRDFCEGRFGSLGPCCRTLQADHAKNPPANT